MRDAAMWSTSPSVPKEASPDLLACVNFHGCNLTGWVKLMLREAAGWSALADGEAADGPGADGPGGVHTDTEVTGRVAVSPEQQLEWCIVEFSIEPGRRQLASHRSYQQG